MIIKALNFLFLLYFIVIKVYFFLNKLSKFCVRNQATCLFHLRKEVLYIFENKK